uniref:Protein-tyrosine-phosphatase n=1 Tax=Panagrolaimus sp. PS1159 TaxID=55785 RepID=A0AC35FC09_9BILA
MSDAESPEQRKAMENFVAEYEKTTTDKLNFQFLDIRKDQADLREDDAYSCSIGQSPQNFLRNRYRDILPYNPDGYINASHITFPETSTQYIASQAPLPETVVDFWQMICQYKIKVVAMLCKCVESFAPKCEQYWPKEEGETKTYGSYTVTFVKEDAFNEYSHRSLLVKSEKYGELQVEQLHYTEWPDHGCPTGEQYILQLMERMNELHANDGSPILLHCSAGCGRTGTVIALNIIRELMNSKKLVLICVKQLVLDLRKQRTSMVQTQTQYHLLHKCIAVYCKKMLGITTETKSPSSPPEIIKPISPKLVTQLETPKKLPLISPKPSLITSATNAAASTTAAPTSTEKPTLTINTSNGSNNAETSSANTNNTNPFLNDVANDNAELVVRL